MTTAALARVAGAVVLAGLLRTAWIHTGVEGLDGLLQPEPALEVRFAGLRPLLPARGTVGYFSDAPAGEKGALLLGPQPAARLCALWLVAASLGAGMLSLRPLLRLLGPLCADAPDAPDAPALGGVELRAGGDRAGAFLVARLRSGPLPSASRRLLTAAALVWLGDAAVYLTTPFDLDWHLRTSIDRLILQAWPLLLLALGIAWPEPQPSTVTASPPAPPLRAPPRSGGADNPPGRAGSA